MPTFKERLKPRFAAFGVVIFVVLTVLGVRLWSMQVLDAEAFAKQAAKNRLREIPMDAPRGRILDRNGKPLVQNRATPAVLVPPSAKDDAELLEGLSVLLSVPQAEIMERLESVREAPLEPRVVAVDVPEATVAYLAEHEADFPGVEIRIVGVRDYPQGNVAAHLLGYTGVISEDEMSEADYVGYEPGDTVGKTGAEKEFESVLQGDHGRRLVEVDASGRQRDVISETDAVPGRDIVLSVDVDVQRVAEVALANAMKDAQAQGFKKARAGAAVVVDVQTGEVIAMASAPTYDPRVFIGGIAQPEWKTLNAPGSEYPLNNRAIMSAYPPASTFKAITGMSALQNGLTKEWKQYHCAGRWEGMGAQWAKSCWLKTGHGSVTFHSGIVESCDTVFYELGHALYKQKGEPLQDTARQFGFGSQVGIDLPGEVPGRVPDAEWKADFNRDYPEYQAWLPGDTVNMSIGQGDLLATPLQMAVAYGAVATDGRVVKPTVLKSVLDADGKPVIESVPETAGVVAATPGQFGIIRRALKDVTEEGTARSAFAGFPVSVLGKTGTAEVRGKDDYAWFVAVAPAGTPKYAVSVVVEQGGHGGSTAAPAAREILSKLMGLPVKHVRAYDKSR